MRWMYPIVMASLLSVSGCAHTGDLPMQPDNIPCKKNANKDGEFKIRFSLNESGRWWRR